MGRKKKKKSGHQWVREDQRVPEPETPEGEEEEVWKSRTQRRDEAAALDVLGLKLVGLSDGMLAKLPLGERLRDEIVFARRVTSHEAKRRQQQLIGKLLRTQECDIGEALAALEAGHRGRDRRLFRWQQRIIAEGGPAIEAFLADHPHAERQRLRALWRTVSQDPEKAGTLLSYLYEAAPADG